MSTKYPQGIITATPPFKATSGQNYSGVWTLEQLAKNFYYYGTAVPNSLRFRASASAYLDRTPASAGNRQTWTWSAWVKRGTLGSAQVLFCSDVGTSNTTWLELEFDAGDTISLQSYTTDINTTTAVFRDPSAWYHVVVAFDSTQATAANRCKIYINGTQQTLTGAGFTLNASYGINNAQAHGIGYRNWASGVGRYFDGYMAEVNFIDGQALTPSSFGSISGPTGVWCPIKYSGTYGTNGFHLDFSNGTSTTTLGYDSSGNSNNWTTNNISLTAGSTYDWMIDSPTTYAGSSYGVGNYAVLNPLNIGSASSLNSGNLNYNATSSSGSVFQSQITSSFSITSGKYYWEVTPSTTSASGVSLGIAKSTRSMTVNPFASGVSGEIYVYIGTNGNKHDGVTSSAYGATYTTNDVIGVALNMDAGTITFYKNNTSQGTAFSSISGSYMPFLVCSGSGETNAGNFNFGQRPFAYTPPSGFKSLCTYNLSTPTIQQGNKFMDATLYTGTGASLSVTNAGGFQPDFVWIKSRSAATDHKLTDSVRGVTKGLVSNSTAAETTDTTGLTAFGSGGFTVGANTTYNNSAATYVGWQWKASNAAAVTNTAGSITSQVSANTTSGFSVVTFSMPVSGTATIGHGLNATPSLIIMKQRAGTAGWATYHSSIGATQYLLLQTTDAAATLSTVWNNTSPTSSVWTVGTAFNGLGTYVAYCFAAIPGYSAFGSYTGNGSADGPFVYLGFRPRYVLFKSTSTAYWGIYDSVRNTYNSETLALYPNDSLAELSDSPMDFLSNGFKLRGTSAFNNGSGSTYIYAAFAESPFNYALAR